MSPVIILVCVILTQNVANGYFYSALLERARSNRHCHQTQNIIGVAGISNSLIKANTSTKFSAFSLFLCILLFLLTFLGFLKGAIGLWINNKIGIYGLNLLIDLPQPLDHYEEKELERRPVVYDVGGWPVHPDTLEKTVKVLPKRTEFCLNLVFFLAYPLAACAYLCAFCCCIRNLSEEQEGACFKQVDVIRLTEHESENYNTIKQTKKGRGRMDTYKNENDKEELDTKYVLDAMEKSKESLHEYRINMEET